MSILKKYDELIHVVEESDLSYDDQVAKACELFDKFDNVHTSNDDRLTDYIIEKYSYGRSLGLTMTNAAYSAEVSVALIGKCLVGEGLSLERFVAIAKAELFAVALMQRKHLAVLAESSEKGNPMSATTFLKTAYPDLYKEKNETEHILTTKSEKTAEELLRDRGIPVPEFGEDVADA